MARTSSLEEVVGKMALRRGETSRGCLGGEGADGG